MLDTTVHLNEEQSNVFIEYGCVISVSDSYKPPGAFATLILHNKEAHQVSIIAVQNNYAQEQDVEDSYILVLVGQGCHMHPDESQDPFSFSTPSSAMIDAFDDYGSCVISFHEQDSRRNGLIKNRQVMIAGNRMGIIASVQQIGHYFSYVVYNPQHTT